MRCLSLDQLPYYVNLINIIIFEVTNSSLVFLDFIFQWLFAVLKFKDGI